jgi:regulator of protease activity HflC (stomatin/prohibitin superfamily)
MKATQKAMAALTVAMAMLAATGCTTRIGPGNVGIEVDQSGSQRGVQDITLKTGRVWYNPYTTSIIEYPTFMRTVTWTKSLTEGNPANEEITFNTKDSMKVDADFNLSYTLLEAKIPYFYVQFRSDDLQKFDDGWLHNAARICINDTAGGYEIDKIMGDNGPWLHEAEKCIKEKVSPYGVDVSQFGIIGSPRPPDAVIQAINMKVQATQLALQKQNEVAQAEAEAKKLVAQAEGEASANIARAKGESEANRLKAASITEPLIKWYALTNEHDRIWHWDGKMPTTLMGQAGPAAMLLQTKPE